MRLNLISPLLLFSILQAAPADAKDYVHEVGKIPFLEDGYIPQGVASNCQLQTSCSSEKVYLSYYWTSLEGDTADSDSFANKVSRVAEISIDGGFKTRRCFSLQGKMKYEHVGGLAYYKNAFYVASDGYVERYEIPAFDSATNGYGNVGCVNANADGAWKVEASSALGIVSISGVDYLLAGRFCSDSDDCDGEDPFMYSYQLKSDGSLKASADGTATVIKKYRVPMRTQGIAGVYSSTNKSPRVLFTTSYGDNTSYFSKYTLANLECSLSAKECSLPSAHYKRDLPAGMEGIAFAADKAWTASESSANYYQNRESNPWSTDYPFLIYIQGEELP